MEKTPFYSEIHILNNISKFTNKKVYNQSILQSFVTPKNEAKWIECYPFLEGAPWDEIYRIPFIFCRDTFIQSLQYKILHRYFNCKYNLNVWGISENPCCDYCENIDTIVHFLYECEIVNVFWKSVQKWFYSITDVNIPFSVTEVIFGTLEKTNISYVRNFIILQGKRFIYEKKKDKKDIFLLEFLYKIKNLLLAEKKISKNSGNLGQYERRFEILLDFIE